MTPFVYKFAVFKKTFISNYICTDILQNLAFYSKQVDLALL